MFERRMIENIPEISHKRIESPSRSVYFNHIHNHAEILFFISGEADYNIDGKLYRPRPFDILLIPSATYHYLIPTSEMPYENYVIGFDASVIEREYYSVLFSSPLMIGAEGDKELTGFFERLDIYDKRYDEDDFERCALCLIRELAIYLCHKKKNTSADGEEAAKGSTHHRPQSEIYIDRMIEYINGNIEGHISIDCVAEHFHLSRSYVQNMFSQYMHIGLKKYIMQKKVYAAAADIEKGMRPSVAATKYGFSDYSVFYRLYKKELGRSPRD